jgi:ATP phosphoribosyltransferase regulatory subunit
VSIPNNNRWLLPDGIEEILPPDALDIEQLRQQILALYHRWGYDLVMPAMIEFTDSLLTGTATTLHNKTFTMVDQATGRLMGLRSDMTPQVARIDAHKLGGQGISRLCYCGQLVHARPDGLNPSRSPLQIGAEIFGNASIDADIEVVSLMLETLHRVPLKDVSIDLGHVGLFRGLFSASGLATDTEQRLFDMLQRKSLPELKAFLGELDLDEQTRQQFFELALLNGGVEVIEQARDVLHNAPAACLAALDHIEAVARGVQALYPDLFIHCDLSELRGYEYHTGLVFAAFLPGQGREIARGGRYDEIGQAFGVARPATGFSADLLNLYQLAQRTPQAVTGILAPNSPDPALKALVRELREKGERVVCDLSNGQVSAKQQRCAWIIEQQGGQWAVKEIK